jgi:hypothetical protein
VHLRRALLLFAIVLGLAALTASLSRPREQGPNPFDRTLPETTVGPGKRSNEKEVRFTAEGPPRTRTLRLGSAGTVTVAVDESGQARLEGLGLVAPAEPLTPASFPVHADLPGRYPVLFTPAGEERSRRVGTLVVR